MNRRDFLRLTSTAALAQGLIGSSSLTGAITNAPLDKYGGWTGKKFHPTGYFRVEKTDRWWIVTPEGNAFLSFGINHLEPFLFQQDYNWEAWKKRLGYTGERGTGFNKSLRGWYLKTCKQYGFNTAGVHTSLYVLNNPRPEIPYMQPVRFVDIPHWKPDVPDENFRDVFSEEYKQYCDELAKNIVVRVKDDPYLLGYSMTDCPLLTEEDCRERPDVIGGSRRESRIGWPRRLRNLDGNAAGKKAYVVTMRKLYRSNIKDFNRTYGTKFKSFDGLLNAKNWRPNTDLSNGYETRDNVEFLKVVVDKYYKTSKAAIRKYDTNHMFIGDKINANTDTMDTVLPVTSKYTDIVMYQMYAKYEVQKPGLDRWSRIVDKPFLNGDSAFTMITDTMPRPYGPVADTLEERADWTEEFFRKAFARPEFVGWHYCGLIDATNRMERKKLRQHSGLLTETGEPYPKLQKVIKSCADDLYSIALK